MSTAAPITRFEPARSVAPDIHAWLVPASTPGEPGSRRKSPPADRNTGSWLLLPFPVSAGAVSVNSTRAVPYRAMLAAPDPLAQEMQFSTPPLFT